jgi:hypothetical protein
VKAEAPLPQGRTATVQCGLFTHKSVPVIFEPPCKIKGINDSRLNKEETVEEIWIDFKSTITTEAERILGYQEKQDNREWFDEECRETINFKNKKNIWNIQKGQPEQEMRRIKKQEGKLIRLAGIRN